MARELILVADPHARFQPKGIGGWLALGRGWTTKKQVFPSKRCDLTHHADEGRSQTFRVLSDRVSVLPCSARAAAAFRGASWVILEAPTKHRHSGSVADTLWASKERRGVGRIVPVSSLPHGNRPLLGRVSRGLRGFVGTCGTMTCRDLTTMGWRGKNWRSKGSCLSTSQQLSCPLQVGYCNHFESGICHAQSPATPGDQKDQK